MAGKLGVNVHPLQNQFICGKWQANKNISCTKHKLDFFFHVLMDNIFVINTVLSCCTVNFGVTCLCLPTVAPCFKKKNYRISCIDGKELLDCDSSYKSSHERIMTGLISAKWQSIKTPLALQDFHSTCTPKACGIQWTYRSGGHRIKNHRFGMEGTIKIISFHGIHFNPSHGQGIFH